MAIQRSQWEEAGTVVLALLLKVKSLPFHVLVLTLIFASGKALLSCIRK